MAIDVLIPETPRWVLVSHACLLFFGYTSPIRGVIKMDGEIIEVIDG